jgi:hypothetical protein
MDSRIALLLELIDSAYDRRSWHGTNLRGSIRGLSLEAVRWRPQAGRHNIWEIMVHAAYWKFCVRRQVTGDRDLRFARRGSDWFELPDPPEAAHFRADLALLRSEHLALRRSVAEFPPSRLGKTPPGLKWRYEQYIQGIASHDLYHAGQIQLLKRLQRAGG